MNKTHGVRKKDDENSFSKYEFWILRQLNYCFGIVIYRRAASRGFSAFFAFMEYRERIAARFDSCRPHHSAALAGAIAGIYIDIPGPQAARAVVGIPAAGNDIAAMQA
jgi:hypothetical protein